MAGQCADGQCFYQVSSRQDGPGDPMYPVVICPKCMTRWFGHKDTEGKILNPKIPDALRDAILLDQIDAVERILADLGFAKRPIPNAILSTAYYNSTPIPPKQAIQITLRPQTGVFRPIYFVTKSRNFMVDDIKIGNRSQFIRAQSVPSEMFLVSYDADLEAFRVRPGVESYTGELRVTMTLDDVERFRLPDACSAFQWEACQTAMDIVVVVTNVSDDPQNFDALILGKVPDETTVFGRGLFVTPVS